MDEARAEEFAGRVFNATVEAMDLLGVYLGDRLGLYKALNDGPATAGQLAERAGIHPRYALEWLEQQAVSAYLDVDDASQPEYDRRYSLSAEHAAALTDLDSPFSVTPMARFLVSLGGTMPKVLEAFRTGGGVSWDDYGPDAIEAQGDFNRPWIVGQLGSEYLPAIPDVHARLQAGTPARVADVACGVGWAAIAIAKAYPNVIVEGFDLDESSIQIASGLATEHGVADRVSFEVVDVAGRKNREPFDLAIMIEALHDFSQPVPALESIRRSLASGGVAIIADELTSETFAAPGNEVERVFYGFSTLCCLPAGMVDQPSAGTGTVMRPATMRAYAQEAGFKDIDILDLAHPMLRFYRLVQ